jgi:hypothetical protein
VVELTDGAVPLVAPGDAEGLAAAARGLLASPGAWRATRKRGYEASRRFLPAAVAPGLVAGIRWARERAVQAPPPAPRVPLAVAENPT